MKKSITSWKKWLTIILCTVLVSTSLDFSAFAQEMGTTESTSVDNGGEEENPSVEEGSQEKPEEDDSKEGNTGTEGSTGTEGNTGTEGSTGTEDNTGTEGSTETEGSAGTEGSTETEGSSGTEGTTETAGTEETTTEETTEETTETVSDGNGLITIRGFASLSSQYAVIILQEKIALQDLLGKMPSSIRAYAVMQQEGNPDQTAEEPIDLSVTWSCEQDYEGTQLTTYYFYPSWEKDRYTVTASAWEELPRIRVEIEETQEAEGIRDEAALVAAIEKGQSVIELAGDIVLTAAVRIPANAAITMDGKGFSLLRGQGYSGAMLYLGGAGYTKDNYGQLTLKNITVNGAANGSRCEAPAIIDHGYLELGKKAVIKNNENHGTQTEKITIEAFGGAVQVFGEMVITEDARVTGNYAEKRGGGIYLAPDSVLYLETDGIKQNTVGEGGDGADLYADNGSTIYYRPEIDMEQEGFHICPEAILIDLSTMMLRNRTKNSKVEIFLNVSEDSGYNIESLKKKLEALGVTVLTSRNYIDTTDLRDWYVYDHYDTDPNCWDQTDDNKDGIPDSWSEYYKESKLRPYFGYTEPASWAAQVDPPVYTIADWLNNPNYSKDGYLRLAQFKEHIYTRKQNGKPEMTFVGYGQPAYVDFLFYNPKSAGEKVVDFDVDSSKVKTHTLAGNGFLVNTGVSGSGAEQTISGLLVYYTYKSDGIANAVNLYSLNNVKVEAFHNKWYDILNSVEGVNHIQSVPITDWQPEMSIQIVAKPDKVEVRQKAKADPAEIRTKEPILTYQMEQQSSDSGFGPLVDYSSHACPMASSFTYSNLKMYFTDPEKEKDTMLNPLQEADFTQDATNKFFLNLFGESDKQYNEEDEFNQYLSYLKMMQDEGISLITDRDTPFEKYLGDSGTSNSLKELPSGGGALTEDEIVAMVKDYVDSVDNTQWDPTGKEEAKPVVSAGNLWLSDENGDQIRTELNANGFGAGYKIYIHSKAFVAAGADPTLTYEINKPDSGEYVSLSLDESGAFTLTDNKGDWPAGSYTVRQKVGTSPVYGYAYFDIKRDSYHLYYHANGGSGGPADTNEYHAGDEVSIQYAPKPVQSGKQFWGWDTDPNAERPKYYKDGADQRVTFSVYDITLYAIWAEEGFDINGKVEEDAKPVEGAIVTLIRANTEYDKTVTDANGEYFFYGIPTGIYNVVVEKDGKIVTEYIEVTGDLTVNLIKLPPFIKNSILQVAPNTPDIVVRELDQIFSVEATDPAKGYTAADKAAIETLGTGGRAEFILNCVGKAPDNMTAEELADAQAIEAAANASGRIVGLYVDFTLHKEITPYSGVMASTPQDETPGTLGLYIFLPEELQNRNDYAIYRCHGNSVDMIPIEANAKGEKFFGVDEEGIAGFQAGKFSLYAVAYRPDPVADVQHKSAKHSVPRQPSVYEEPAVTGPEPVVYVPESSPLDEPKTGDSRLPMIPVAMGAVTVFMLKIMLWMYEFELGITEEKKNEMIRALAEWARGTTKPKIYAAVAGMAAVLLLYHISRRMKSDEKRMVEKKV